MKYFKKLVGERIYLSPRNLEDIEFFTKCLNDMEVTDYVGRTGMMMTIDAERRYLESRNLDLEPAFAIVTLDNDKLIGTISLENVDVINRTAVLGIFIGEADYRNNGYGTEAIKLLLDYAFNYLNINSIRLDLISCNERALKCYKKCGFKECGRWRNAKYVNGKYYDRISMDILAEEFTESYIKNKVIK